MKKILILGGTGMLGHTLFVHLRSLGKRDVYTTTRNSSGLRPWMPTLEEGKVLTDVDANNSDIVIRVMASIKPDIVINCIGLVKQLPMASDPLTAITANSQLPHRISLICSTVGARLIHISTDCVFDGKKGNYSETDTAGSNDLYGRTKLLGEVTYPHCITIRTSLIGHELRGYHGLIEWFVRQENIVQGYTKAVFSGFPTIELSHIIAEHIIPNPSLQGLYHVSSDPISKYDLLKLIAGCYGKKIQIDPFEGISIDRSLNSSRFQEKTGYKPPSWDELVDKMYNDYIRSTHYVKREPL